MGKNGWINQSAYTLVTAAERNGRTLIAVVMKSSGRNDRWEDTAALLDYGFDGFTEINFTAEDLRRDHVPVVGSGGYEINASLFSDNGFSCLIPIAFAKDDVEITYAAELSADNELNAKAMFALKPDTYSSPLTELGELDMQAEIVPASTHGAGQADSQADNQKDKPPILPWFFGIMGLLLFFLLFLLIRRYILMKRRCRRKRAAYAFLRMKKGRAKWNWRN